MGMGKRWSLKTTKEDETTPGPKYAPEKIVSFEGYIKNL